MPKLRISRWLIVALLLCVFSASLYAQLFIRVGFAPPPLPVYEQPLCPEPGLMWIPGYWAYGDAGYYWVPGTWMPAPSPGFLWTPHYWGWEGGRYIFHEGYWGRHVGYYGGVNYGFGYGGIGFAGGEWRGGVFAYNSAVMHVGAGFHSVYVDREVVNRGVIANPGHVGFSGGPGGIHHDPTPAEGIASHETHQAPTGAQQQHQTSAASNPASLAKNNGGHPANAAVGKPLGSGSAAHAGTGASTGKTGGTSVTGKGTTGTTGISGVRPVGSGSNGGVKPVTGSTTGAGGAHPGTGLTGVGRPVTGAQLGGTKSPTTGGTTSGAHAGTGLTGVGHPVTGAQLGGTKSPATGGTTSGAHASTGLTGVGRPATGTHVGSTNTGVRPAGAGSTGSASGPRPMMMKKSSGGTTNSTAHSTPPSRAARQPAPARPAPAPHPQPPPKSSPSGHKR